MEKISLDELRRRIAAHEFRPNELRRYFINNPDAAPEPFHPAVQVDSDNVEAAPSPEILQQFQALGGIAEIIIRAQRRERDYQFNEMIRSGYKGPVIVSDGDSWFLHPLLYDTIDYIRSVYAIKSLDWPGDTLNNIVKQGEYRKAIAETGADIFMVSAGGNDLVGGGALADHLHPFEAAKRPEQYLKESYHALVEGSLDKYRQIFEDVQATSMSVTTICHGYDRVIPNSGSWLGRPMSSKGINDTRLQKAIADVMVDGFNNKLKRLAKRYEPRVYFLDLRGSVTTGWEDELHPTEAGYRQIASHFRWVIERGLTEAKRNLIA